jgi:outer membrane protein assembly factor BamB
LDAENAIPLLEEWMVNTGSRTQYAAAATDNSRVLVGGLDDTLFALTQSDGNSSWQFNRSGALADSSPTISEGKVFVGSGSGIVYALDVSDGSVSWTYKTDSAIISSPTMVNGVIYVGTNDGTIFALDDSGSGSKQWATNVGEAVFSKPAVDNGTVYVSTTPGRLVALDASTGAQQWTFDTDTEVGRSSPIVSNNRLYFAADAMYAFDPETSGNVLWKTAYGGTAGASPSYSSTTGQVFVGSFNGKVYAFNASDGVVNWTHATGGAVGSTPVVAGDRVVIGSDDNNLYLIDASSGSELVRRSVGRIRSEPTVDNDTTFVGTWGGTIVALSNVTT